MLFAGQNLCVFALFWGRFFVDLTSVLFTRSHRFPDKYFKKVSAGAKDLVRKLLLIEPSERLSAAEVLEHPWIVEQCSMENDDLSVNLNHVPSTLSE